MASRKISTLSGFTLIEVMVVLGLLALMAALGMFVSFDYYRSYQYRAELNTLGSMLQKARAQAQSNVNESPHGVEILANAYVIFQGPFYAAREVSLDESFTANGLVSHSGMSEVVFAQLTGEASASSTITLTDGTRTSLISINNEGRIDW